MNPRPGLRQLIPGVVRVAWNGAFGRSLTLLVGSTAIGHLAILFTLPLVARLYHPTDLGRLGTFTAFLATASAVTALRYDVMIVAAASGEEAMAIISGVCLLTLPLSLLCSLLLAWLIHGDLLGFEILPLDAALWMFPALVATQLFFTLRYWLMRGQDFETIARVTVGQSLVRALAPLALVPLGGGWTALVASEVAARCAGLGTLLKARRDALRSGLTSLSYGTVGRVLRSYPDSPLAGLPSAVINNAANYLPLPLIAGAYGPAAAGYFAIVQRAMLVPISLVGRNVADVFHAQLAHHARATTTGGRRLFWRTSLMLAGLGAIPSLLALAVGRPAMVFLLGRQWGTAAELLIVMIPWTLAMFVVSPLSRVVVVYRGQGLKLVYDAVSLGAVFAVMALAARRGWPLVQAVAVMSWSQAATYLIYYLVLVRLIRRAPAGPASGVAALVAE